MGTLVQPLADIIVERLLGNGPMHERKTGKVPHVTDGIVEVALQPLLHTPPAPAAELPPTCAAPPEDD